MAKERAKPKWLGMAGGALAILVFLELTNLVDLRDLVDPDARSREACTAAWRAEENYRNGLPAVTSPGADPRLVHAGLDRTLAMELREAAKLTDEEELKSALFASSGLSRRIADYRTSTGDVLPGSGPQALKAREAWERLCDELR